MNPLVAIADEYGHLRAMRFEKLAASDEHSTGAGDKVDVPLRSLYVAAGTSPNTIYEQEHPGTFKMDGKFFQRYEPRWIDREIELQPMNDTRWPKIGRPAPLTSYAKDGKYISVYGDNHPVYAGNVVKAMASAKDGYPWVVKLHEAEDRRGRSGSAARSRCLAACSLCPARRSPDRDRRSGQPADADDRRGDCSCSDGCERLRAGPLLPSSEFREQRAADRRYGARDRGTRADRRLGRQRTRADFTHRARDGNVVATLRRVAARRSDHRHGGHGHSDGDSVGQDRAPRRRRPRQCGAVLDRQGDARGRQPRDLFRGLPRRRRLVQSRGGRGRGRRRRLGRRSRARRAAATRRIGRRT